MRTPIRKGGKYTHLPLDPHITTTKHQALRADLAKMLSSRPALAKEVQRLAALGDFSENAEYQLAKSKLRGLNQRILDLEGFLKIAIVIHPTAGDRVTLGSKVTVETNDQTKTYQILGSSETNPSAGVISQHSPIGSALLGKKVGDEIKINLGKKIASYKITEIS